MDVLHDDEEVGAGGDHVEGGDDVQVVDAGREPPLVEEHPPHLRVPRVLGVDALDGHGPGEAGVPQHPAEVDGGHPPGRDLVADHVATRALAFEGGHPGEGYTAGGPAVDWIIA